MEVDFTSAFFRFRQGKIPDFQLPRGCHRCDDHRRSCHVVTMASIKRIASMLSNMESWSSRVLWYLMNYLMRLLCAWVKFFNGFQAWLVGLHGGTPTKKWYPQFSSILDWDFLHGILHWTDPGSRTSMWTGQCRSAGLPEEKTWWNQEAEILKSATKMAVNRQ